MAEFVKVAKLADLAAGAGKCVTAGGKKLAVFQVDGKVFALDEACTHRQGPLSEGMISGDQVVCPWHGARFNLATGQAMGGPAPRGVTSYPARITGDDVEVQV